MTCWNAQQPSSHSLKDGCCHQIHDTGRWRDSRLIGGWLTDLAASLHQRSNTALDDAQSDNRTPI